MPFLRRCPDRTRGCEPLAGAVPVVYGETLLRVYEQFCLTVSRLDGLWWASVVESAGDLKRRLKAMKHFKRLSLLRGVFAALIVATVAAIGIVPWRLAAQANANIQSYEQSPAVGQDKRRASDSAQLQAPNAQLDTAQQMPTEVHPQYQAALRKVQVLESKRTAQNASSVGGRSPADVQVRVVRHKKDIVAPQDPTFVTNIITS